MGLIKQDSCRVVAVRSNGLQSNTLLLPSDAPLFWGCAEHCCHVIEIRPHCAVMICRAYDDCLAWMNNLHICHKPHVFSLDNPIIIMLWTHRRPGISGGTISLCPAHCATISLVFL